MRRRTIRIIAIVVIIVIVIVSLLLGLMIISLFFSPKGNITVTRPDDSDNCSCFGSYKIRWNASDSITKVRIELYNGSEYVKDINEMTKNDGIYTWIISKDCYYTSGKQYRIRISDYNNRNVYDYSDYFEISIDYNGDGVNNGDDGNDDGCG